ncbi:MULTISPECIES: hypothetical protein [unclassified Rhizobium]|uniref:hypothetical protein n=1 Tax=unclassified Rhizobium TaxID=2613769 RepID=UPI0006F89381|nr:MULTISPECIES: hypothetical protein [unclassified Rhizobium]KQV39201.1 hypothetical protein ASC86_23320 [Rhizobium sp. Root1212]KRD35175.1 hypothetical protein ASE37_21890 [Rhizobium sp. Root268]
MANTYWRSILVEPDELIRFAWSAPLRDLATMLNISDVGLKKRFVSYGIPLPPQGYWNKVHAGKPVPRMPAMPARKPGAHGRISVDETFGKVLRAADPISSRGPFASGATPENLDALYEIESKAIGSVRVPKTLSAVHPGLQELLKRDEKRRHKYEKTGWTIDQPLFETPAARRQLRILSTLFSVLSKRGHSGYAHERDGQLQITARIGDTPLSLEICLSNEPAYASHSYRRTYPLDVPATTPLTLKFVPGFNKPGAKSWKDDGEGILEDKISLIAVSLIVAGESRFRERLAEDEILTAQLKLEEEKRRRERLERLNLQRLEALKASGELLRQSQDIRNLVDRVRRAIVEGSANIDQCALSEWEEWALRAADELDPIISGQYLAHFRAPTIE